MKPPSAYPVPASYEGRPVLRFRAGTHRASPRGHTEPSRDPEAGMEMFEVIDSEAPYVVLRRERPGPGVWADLEPDFLGRDDEGFLEFIQGHGEIRRRLGALGITKARWEALPARRRQQLVSAMQMIAFFEHAVATVVRAREPTVNASARRALSKMMKLAVADSRVPHGLRSERRRARAFTEAKRLLAVLAPALREVQEEGRALRRATFTDAAWRAERAARINAILTARRLGTPCTAADIGKLGRASPKLVAAAVAGKAAGIPADSLRYASLRFRTKRRARKAAPP